MKPELITKVLDGITGVRKDGAAHLVPEETEVSVYIGIAAEVLTVPRVSRVTVTGDLLSIETFKSERYFFTPEAVVGLKAGAADGKSLGRGGAGFGLR
jgi:hypothetical protein